MARTPLKSVSLYPATEQDFRWMLGGRPSRLDLLLPEGGVAEAATLRIVHATMLRVLATHGWGVWLIVVGNEIVGLCSYKCAPNYEGEVEIGFGIAPSRRNRGYATEALRSLIAIARDDPPVKSLRAETAIGNLHSRRVLERNGFVRTGTAISSEDGAIVLWHHKMSLNDTPRG
jgi:RimJ/RimL family protein N-acetyltransferase